MFCLDDDGTRTFADKVINKAAERLIGFGKGVFIAMPNLGNIERDIEKSERDRKTVKMDFNDLACQGGINTVRRCLDNAIPYKQFSKNFGFKDKESEFGGNLAENSFGKNKSFQNPSDVTRESKTAGNFNQNIKKQSGLQISRKVGLDLEI